MGNYSYIYIWIMARQSPIGDADYASIPLPSLSYVAAISVELSEVLGVSEATAYGEFTRLSPYSLALDYDDIDPIDNDCSGAKCVGIYTRVRTVFIIHC